MLIAFIIASFSGLPSVHIIHYHSPSHNLSVMNDIETIENTEALASKLGHGIFEVRLRSASNLLFKLNNKVIDQGVLNLPMAVKMISSGVLEGLQLFKLSVAHEPSNDVDTHSSETIPKTKIENNTQ